MDRHMFVYHEQSSNVLLTQNYIDRKQNHCENKT